MRVCNITAYLFVALSTFTTIIPAACANKTYRTLEHHVSKGSKKSFSSGGSSKGESKTSDDSVDLPDLSMSMDVPAMSLDMSLDMSYPSGKGKGKGEKKASHKSGKGSLHSKSGKKGSKSEKKSGKGKGSTDTPSGKGGTVHPAPSPSSLDTERPPSPVPPPPSAMPVDNPDLPALQEVTLPRYGLSYTLPNNMMPMREDYFEVEQLTQDYFSDYMLGVFDEPAGNNLVHFRTTLHTSEFRFDEPVVIVYGSVAYFSADMPASSLPTPQTLETILRLSLVDSSEYLDLLRELGVENPFSNTISVDFDDSNGTDSTTRSTQSGKSGASPAAIAAGAVGATLLVAGMLLYRRRNMESDEDYFMQKNLNSKNRDGGATVAGETYAGETYDGTASVSPSSHLSGDEEQGLMNVDLDDSSVAMDASSVSPSWECLSTAPALDDDDESESGSEGEPNEGTNDTEKDDILTRPASQSSNTEDLDGSGSASMDDEESDSTQAATSSFPTESTEETSVTSVKDEFVAPTYATKTLEAFDTYLEAKSGSMSVSSQETEQENESTQSSRRPLSVAEIEAMLNSTDF